VDSVFKTLTADERIAQLIMVAAYSNRDQAHIAELSKLIQEQKIGGLVFFQGGPVRQAIMTNQFQAQSKVPLLIAIDGEWGLGMRLDSTIRFPYQMTLGAIQDDQLIYRMGTEVARQCKRLGIHVNFAPVVDVNNNPNNPVINYRSFGEDKDNVSRKGIAYMKGMQDAGIVTSAKHFPGHGDTDADSHFALPVITHPRQRLDSLEMYPFRKLIEAGLSGMMVAHLSVPSLDSTKNLPSTLSKPIVTDILRKQLGFQGLIFTDAMNMQGVTKSFPSGLADAKAIIAGNDVLEFTENVTLAIAEIKKAIKKGQISQQEIDQRCRKMLAAKAWVGLDHYQLIDLTNLSADLNTSQADLLNRQLLESSLTLLKNNRNLVPLQRLDTLKIATIAIGAGPGIPFQQMVGQYTKATPFYLSLQNATADLYKIRESLKAYNLLLVSVHVPSIRPPKNYGGITEPMIQAVQELARSGKAIVTLFGNPYTISKFTGITESGNLLLAYQDNTPMQELAAQLLFGGIKAKGKLPVTIENQFRLSSGLLTTTDVPRFKYTLPEEVGIDSGILTRKIDSLVNVAITQKATPGCQIFVAKEGKVIFQKSYGFHTYENKIPVANTDLYDLASVTKVSASLPALMRLTDEGKFNVDKTLADYLPDYKKSNKKDIALRQILAHQGRLKAWIPFWKNTVKKNGKLKWFTFKTDSTKRFPIKVADNLYLHRKYPKKIYKAIRKSPLQPEVKYEYSDLSYYLYPQIVQKQTGKDFATYLKETFYQPLGASTLTFNAEKYYPKNQIVPTEYDSLFRKSLLHGTVHDEGAAMLGGLSGHAGLFGTANDLAKLMQMYLNGGTYGGVRYINEATLKEFERCQFCETGNRRAIGFDKPMIKPTPNGSAAMSASPESFGHSGFTGTFTWVDPKNQLVYVFLSNRVYPTRNNGKLGQLNTRTNIQQAIYDAIEQSKGLPAGSAGK
jgi:beta-glucosidase-like glycosyl hydrolase/CubicO group peptidase (beta-lactamase class C family)